MAFGIENLEWFLAGGAGIEVDERVAVDDGAENRESARNARTVSSLSGVLAGTEYSATVVPFLLTGFRRAALASRPLLLAR